MKAIIKKCIKGILPAAVLDRIRAYRTLPVRLARLERQTALLAAHTARRAYAGGSSTGHSAINDHELQVYSQHGEDGILQFLFSEIGATNRTFVEFGMGDGRECNTAYLSLHQGWHGLLMDGCAERAAAAVAYYRRMLGPNQDRVKIAHAWVTAENINDTIRNQGISGEIDLLSIDVDGIDYWIWKALDAVNPRVVVIEYSAVTGPARAVTIPNDPRFSRWERHESGLYAGASLAALAKLGEAKGYRLVGCNAHGVNAFFVRNDLGAGTLPAVEPAVAYYPCDDLILGPIAEARFGEVLHLEWEEV